MSFDVAPAAPLVAQPFGCTPYTFEVPCPDCPSGRKHLGVDLWDGTADGSAYAGSPVYATRTGSVYLVGYQSALEGHDFGPNAVCLELDEGGWLWYGHLQAAAVNPGDRVQVGSVVGYGGSLGISTGPHLHLEYRTAYPNPAGAWAAVAGAEDPTPYLNYPAPAVPVRRRPKEAPMLVDDLLFLPVAPGDVLYLVAQSADAHGQVISYDGQGAVLTGAPFTLTGNQPGNRGPQAAAFTPAAGAASVGVVVDSGSGPVVALVR